MVMKSKIMAMYLSLMLPLATCDGIQNKFLSCPQLTSYCTTYGSTSPNEGPSALSELRQIGKPGKSGAKGSKGDRGEQGPPGSRCQCDSAAIEARILAKVKAMITTCRVIHNNSCFYVVGLIGNKYTKEDLQAKCAVHGGSLANVYDEEHRLKLGNMIRTESTAYVQVTLGMTYNPQTSKIYTASGDVLNSELKWHSTYPNSDLAYRIMYLSVQPDPTSSGQGVYNYLLVSESLGICEYHLGF